ncbi:hypothetical protein FWK35_00019678 [Aphis craccivora]|uniref:Uncharacterized protein n=1 Tax=Aphis craccivora TaxID=307492 RepID=A0A6G0YAI2_APHCR|nr:hypothetical protein FWK35_00019678 [Aphis craccivora]
MENLVLNFQLLATYTKKLYLQNNFNFSKIENFSCL